MGGSFNPIHYAHLAAADEAAARFGLDEIIFMPCGEAPHKPAGELAPADDRYLMTVIAVADCPAYSVSRYEIDKPGPSYTVDTMRHFNEERPHDELYFITGADSIVELETWRDYRELFGLGKIVAATRPGYDVSAAPEATGPAVPDSGPPYATQDDLRECDGLVMGDQIECPKHNGRFNYKTGAALRAPVCVNLATYPARVTGGRIEILI